MDWLSLYLPSRLITHALIIMHGQIKTGNKTTIMLSNGFESVLLSYFKLLKEEIFERTILCKLMVDKLIATNCT